MSELPTRVAKIGSVLRYEFYGDKIDLADDIREEFIPAAKEAVNDAANMLLREIDRLLTLRKGTPGSAAPEGEPPEQDTTSLLRSWELIAPRVKGNVVQAGVKSDSPYAVRLEYGKTDKLGRRVLPHPYVRPAMAAMEGPIGDLLAEKLG